MARQRLAWGEERTITAADVNAQIPGVPEDEEGNMASPLPAGIVNTSGAALVAVDVSSVGTSAGNFTVALLAWDRMLQQWVVDTVLTIAGVDTLPTPRAVSPRAKVSPWMSDWAFALVTAFATNATSVTTAIVVPIQDT